MHLQRRITSPDSATTTPSLYVVVQKSGNRSITDAWQQLGALHHRDGRLESAKLYYDEALQYDPSNAFATNGLGVLQTQRNDAHEAVITFRRALVFDDTLSEIWTNYGLALSRVGRNWEAEPAIRRAIELRPENVTAHVALGIVQMDLFNVEASVAAFNAALVLDPKSDIAGLNAIYAHALLDVTPAEALAVRQQWYRVRKQETPCCTRVLAGEDPERRLRIGYVSPDLRMHSASVAFMQVLIKHDRDAFEIFAYSDAEKGQEDTITKLIESSVDHFTRTNALTAEQLCERIRSDQIDILVDLAGFTVNNRLAVFCHRAAPIQVTAFGYAHGTGIETMDYFFADPVTVPAHEFEHFTERVWYLPSVIPFTTVVTTEEPGPPPSATYRTVSFSAFTRLTKVSPAVCATWTEILRAVPESTILFKDKAFAYAETFDWIRERLPVDPARIRCLTNTSYNEHLGAYGLVDIALDPFPHAGGVTALEALWMGTPIVTLRGRNTAGRSCASFLTQLNRKEWIAETPEEYVEIAVQLAKSVPGVDERRALRQSMRESVLVNGTYVHHVETAYREMWRRAALGGERP